jgi:hypothetical protein
MAMTGDSEIDMEAFLCLLFKLTDDFLDLEYPNEENETLEEFGDAEPLDLGVTDSETTVASLLGPKGSNERRERKVGIDDEDEELLLLLAWDFQVDGMRGFSPECPFWGVFGCWGERSAEEEEAIAARQAQAGSVEWQRRTWDFSPCQSASTEPLAFKRRSRFSARCLLMLHFADPDDPSFTPPKSSLTSK